MAKIIGAVASSHTPTIGFALDRNKQDDPAWAPIFTAFAPIQAWLAEKKPDVLFMIFNDHVTSFFFDHYSPFVLGIGDSYAPADEGGGARALPPVKGHAALAQHIGTSLMNQEFDLSFFQGKSLDHGCFSPLSLLWPHKPDWPAAIVPLQVGVLQFPIPTAKRCYKLGQALRTAIESFPQDLKVVVVGTGGLSHQVHGERAGFNNTAWDAQFMELIEKDPVRLTELTHADYAKLGGMEGSEIIMWLIMRGALSANVKKIHQSYYLPSMTGIGVAIYENEVASDSLPVHAAEKSQLAGIEELAGTYPFTLDKSVRVYRLNSYLHNMVDPAHRKKFLDDAEASFAEHGLTEAERDLVRRRDWRGLIHYGVIFFVLEKLGAVVGVSNLHIYAGMRGETLEEFQKTRNAPGALYSTGTAQGANWSQPQK